MHRFVHSDSPSSRCKVRGGMAGFGDAALGTTLVTMDLVVVCLPLVHCNSTQVQHFSRSVLAEAMHLVVVCLLAVYLNSTQEQTGSTKCTSSSNGPSRHIPTRTSLEFYKSTA